MNEDERRLVSEAITSLQKIASQPRRSQWEKIVDLSPIALQLQLENVAPQGLQGSVYIIQVPDRERLQSLEVHLSMLNAVVSTVYGQLITCQMTTPDEDQDAGSSTDLGPKPSPPSAPDAVWEAVLNKLDRAHALALRRHGKLQEVSGNTVIVEIMLQWIQLFKVDQLEAAFKSVLGREITVQFKSQGHSGIEQSDRRSQVTKWYNRTFSAIEEAREKLESAGKLTPEIKEQTQQQIAQLEREYNEKIRAANPDSLREKFVEDVLKSPETLSDSIENLKKELDEEY